MDAMIAHPVLGKHLVHPSLSYGSQNLYAHGIFEQVLSDALPAAYQGNCG